MTSNEVLASTAIRSKNEAVIDEALRLQWERWPDLPTALTPRQLENVRKDTRYHVDFLASALWAEEQLLFDDYVRWVKVLFENLGLPQEWVTGSLADVSSALESVLGEEASAGVECIARSVDAMESFETEVASFIEPGQPLGALAVRYLGAVLGGDRFGASGVIHDALSEGAAIRDVYTYVFQRAQLELGRLWQLNRITVAQEHYATAVTQMVMSQLYPQIFRTQKNGYTLVAACVGGELHEMGMRMVADFFEMEAWNTHYIGANTPPSAIVETVRTVNADVLALSATMSYHLPEIFAVIEELRGAEHGRDVKVIVGGYPFNLAPDLWSKVGADGCARDAREAIKVASALVAS